VFAFTPGIVYNRINLLKRVMVREREIC